MGKVRSVEYDGGIKTKYIQESDGKLTINNQQDVNPLLKRNKELSILVSVIVYILNIIDANVDAHLKSYNIDDKLTIKAILGTYNSEDKNNFGLSINLNL